MRRIHVIVSVALVAVACAYWLGRAWPELARSGDKGTDAEPSAAAKDGAIRDPDGRVAGSARGGRTKGYFPDLRAAADAGDLVASTRLYRGLSLCHRLRAMDWSNTLLANELLDAQTRTMLPAQLQGYQAQLDAIESRKQNAQRLQARCDTADAAMMDSLVPSLMRAAQLGETHARACYLAMGPNYDARALARHPEWLETYRASVPAMIDAGLAAGDWRIVNVLRNAYQPGADSLLAGVLDSDPEQHFRYLKLYRLGAGAGDAEVLDRQLAAAAARLPPQRLAEAAEWAETTFRRDFNGRSATAAADAGLDPCVFPYE